MDDKAEKRIALWKRKLLDLTAGSSLLNFSVEGAGQKAICIAREGAEEVYKKMCAQEACDPVAGADETLRKAWANIRRSWQDYAAQCGANALFLTFGAVEWTEDGKEKYLAPVVMMPAALWKRHRDYLVRYDKGAIYVNEALTEMLGTRFDLSVEELRQAIALDVEFPRYAEIYQALSRIVACEKRITLLDMACVGFFKYGQYALWNDLDKHFDVLTASPIVRGILDGMIGEEVLTGEGETSAQTVPSVVEADASAQTVPSPDEADASAQTVPSPDEGEASARTVLSPIEADAFQLGAAEAAMRGRSFVLHGPPGTGKSQTIALILANRMCMGKSVLFAAEKAPALQVVYDRLRKIGLDRFCLFLPAIQKKSSDKEAVLNELKAVLELSEPQDDPQTEETQRELLDVGREIERQIALLHGPRLCGFSAYELIEGNLRYEEKYPDALVELSEPFVETLGSEQIGRYEDSLRKLCESGALSEPPSVHPLRDWGPYQYVPQMQNKIRPLLEAYRDALDELAACCGTLNVPGAAAGSAPGLCRSQLTQYMAYLRTVEMVSRVPEAFLAAEDPAGEMREWLRAQKYQDALSGVARIFTPNGMQMNGAQLYEQFRKLLTKAGAPANIKKQLFLRNIQAGLKLQPPDEAALLKILKALAEFQKLPPVKNRHPEIPASYRERAAAVLQLLEKNPAWKEAVLSEARTRSHEEWENRLSKLQDACNKVTEACAALDAVQGISPPLWDKTEQSNIEARERANRWLRGLDYLREWGEYQKARRECQKLGLAPFVELYEKGKYPDELTEVFRKNIFAALVKRLYAKHEDIQKFAGYRFETLLARYEALSARIREESVLVLRNRMIRNIRAVLADKEYQTEIVVLRRAIESGGKRMTLRMIFSQIPRLLRALKPCIIVSPLSAAQYFDPDRITFDTLIFDEASQIQTWKAIGLVGRSRQVIVAGDPNQMPPTNFFSVPVSDEDVLPWEDDQESILKDCLAAGMPGYYLRWHYRSRHESLITFSNKKYYESKMLTCPSADDRDAKVRLIPVNGVYERGKGERNRIEAARVVEWLKERVTGNDNRSYGIITFNKNQRDLIEDLIEDARETCKEFDEKLRANPAGEELFVRNLESVQGDERDVILFSVGYGPDEEGKITMNFGPLQNAGGWRRLNVAVTRARDEMIFFSSLRAKDMRISETTARAVADLKELLAYAEKNSGLADGQEEFADPGPADGQEKFPPPGSVDGQEESEAPGSPDAPDGICVDAFCGRIASVIRAQGYEYDLNVGASNLRVDIAVRDRNNPRRYLLGILLHRRQFYENDSLYDREIGQLRMLRQRGWDLLRIWPLDWQEDHHREEQRIIKKLKEKEEQKNA